MRTDFTSLAGVLHCPDDSAPLICEPAGICCHACGRHFPVYDGGIAELLPSQPFSIPHQPASRYWHAYLHAYRQGFRHDEGAVGWGAPEANPEAWIRRRLRQVQLVRALVHLGEPTSQQILCDVAAGSGHYSLAYAPIFRHVLHCDLSVDNLNYAAHRARAMSLQNIFFLRVDYFAMPFRHSVDRVLCFDTLIRGEQHDVPLLRSIRQSLKPDGRALVDFHNWWHNPVRRLGFMQDNFADNRSYRLKEAERVLVQAGVDAFEAFAFHQEFSRDSKFGPWLTQVLPPTRWVFRFAGAPVVLQHRCLSEGMAACVS